MRFRLCAIALLLLVANGGVAGAQVVATVDAGTGSVRYDDLARSLVISVSPTVVRQRATSTLLATGTVSQFEGGGVSAQGMLAGSIFSRAYGPLRGELAGRAGLSAHRDIVRAGQLLGQARAHLVGDERGLWLGGGVGRSWANGDGNRMLRADAGVWARFGDALLRVSLASTTFADSAPTGVPPLNPPPGSAPYRRFTSSYSDADLGLEWARGRLSLDASVGRRFGARVAELSSWSVGGAVRLTNHMALLAATGSYAPDLTQRLPGGRYATVALRLSLLDASTIAADAASPAVALAFETRRGEDGGYTFSVHAPRARRVELMGDFTDWRPVALARGGGGLWAVTLPVAPGTHRVNVRVNGGSWLVPPGATAVKDEFNGLVGVIIVGGEGPRSVSGPDDQPQRD
ncbi:MAG: glycogen-binding domain-containing protein [Gemmatimonadaceae bacterium]